MALRVSGAGGQLRIRGSGVGGFRVSPPPPPPVLTVSLTGGAYNNGSAWVPRSGATLAASSDSVSPVISFGWQGGSSNDAPPMWFTTGAFGSWGPPLGGAGWGPFTGPVCALGNGCTSASGNTDPITVALSCSTGDPVLLVDWHNQANGGPYLGQPALVYPPFSPTPTVGDPITSLGYLAPSDADYDTLVQVSAAGELYVVYFRGLA